MKKDLWHLSLSQLRELYQESRRQLDAKLLAGSTWEEVCEDRKRLGELSTIIYKKSNPAHFGNTENASQSTLE